MAGNTRVPGIIIQSGSIPTTALSGGVVSSSAQITSALPAGTLSSSAQVQLNSITGTTFSNNNFTFPQNLTVNGTLTAERIQTEYVTSSIIYESGSSKFGDSLDDTHQFTGSLGITGSLLINGTSYTAATSGTSGTAGSSGSSGSAGSSGTSGSSGTAGTSGTSGSSGTSGTAGSSGTSGTRGSSGTSGTSGSTGTSGTSGSSGTSGTGGSSGTSGTSGSSGTSGTSGSSGTSGTSGSSGTAGTSGSSGTSGTRGSSGTSGANGSSGSSGTSGANGSSGSSGTSGANGSSGTSGTSASVTINNNTDNYIVTATGTTNTLNGEANLTFDGTNLGVGTTSALRRLHVYSGSIIGGITSTTGVPNVTGVTTVTAFEARSTSAGNHPSISYHKEGVYTIYLEGQATPRGLKIYTATDETPPGLFVTGSVGIGTTNPGYKLEVNGTTGLGGTLNIPQNTWIQTSAVSLIRDSYFGYSVGYRAVQIGTNGATRAISLGVDLTSNASGNFNGKEIVIPNDVAIIAPVAANNSYIGVLKIDSSNNLCLGGANYTTAGHVYINNSSGNVGIDTTNPTVRLEVQRATDATGLAEGLIFKIKNTSTTTDSRAGISFGNIGTIGSNLAMQSAILKNGTTGEYDMIWDLYGGSAGWKEALLYLDSNPGRVGINTASPALPLHVTGTPNSDGAVARFATSAPSSSITIAHSLNGGYIGYGAVGAGDAANTFYVTTGAGTIGSGIIMNNAGNVGIGTTSITSISHGGTNVVLNIYNSGTATNSQSHIILLSNASAATNSAVGSISWGLPNATATNKGIAYIAGSTATDSTSANPSGFLAFATRKTTDSTFVERMRLDKDGNLGINQTSPGYTLDVTGTGRFTGATVIGGPLLQGSTGGTSRSTSGTSIVFTNNSTFAANTDIGDGGRFLSIVNESTTTSAYAQLGFRVNPNGGGGNAMFDLKFENLNTGNTSKLHFTFNHSGTFADRVTIHSNGNVGIGSTNPQAPLQIGSDAVGGNAPKLSVATPTTATSTENSFILITRTGYSAALLGLDSSGAGNTATNNIFVVATETGKGGIDLRTGGNYTNGLQGGTSRLRILDGGNVGIGSTNPATYKLEVTGTIYASSDVIAYSDSRVKENVVTIDNALNKVTNLRGVYYTRKDEEDKKTNIGVIAQEVLEVVPELVSYAEDNDQYAVKYQNITALLIEAIKEQQHQIQHQAQELAMLKALLENK